MIPEKKYSQHLGMSQLADEDRPREKLLQKGKNALTEAELLAILIGSGSKEENALDLAKRILSTYENDLNELYKKSIADFKKFKGIGSVKAIGLVAALELGRRRQLAVIKEKQQIKSSRDAFVIFHPILGDLPHEEFWVLYLNRSNKIIAKERISIGGVAGTIADVKIIFKKAMELLSSAIILIHNHPSGNLKPSQADLNLTKKVVEAGKLMEVSTLDHLIVTDGGYYSFADEGSL